MDDRGLFEDFIKYLFLRCVNFFLPSVKQQVKEFFRGESLPEKAILLIDNALCYPKEGELKALMVKYFVMCLPLNYTAFIQPNFYESELQNFAF